MMKLNEALHINERSEPEIIKDYGGLRTIVARQVKIDSNKDKILKVIRNWAGGMEGVKSVKSLITKLSEKSKDFKNDQLDKIIIKAINEILIKKQDELETIKSSEKRFQELKRSKEKIIPVSRKLL